MTVVLYSKHWLLQNKTVLSQLSASFAFLFAFKRSCRSQSCSCTEYLKASVGVDDVQYMTVSSAWQWNVELNIWHDRPAIIPAASFRKSSSILPEPAGFSWRFRVVLKTRGNKNNIKIISHYSLLALTYGTLTPSKSVLGGRLCKQAKIWWSSTISLGFWGFLLLSSPFSLHKRI